MIDQIKRLRNKKGAATSDILLGIDLVIVWILITLVLWGLFPCASYVTSVPVAPALAALPPINTQGDIVIINLITGYAAAWGIRLIGKSISIIRECNEDIVELMAIVK